MPGERRPGMDHALYEYSPLPMRPPLRWPGGTKVAFWVILYLEEWELDPPAGSHRPPGIQGVREAIFPDYRTYSLREFGNRVGFFRVAAALDELGLRPTVAANASLVRTCPRVIEECMKRGWEIAAHGTHATRMITSRMSEDDERAHIAGAVEDLRRVTGTRPQGWIGQDFGESTRTPQLVAEQGLEYLADWANDEQPYPMLGGRLVSLPQQANWDGLQLLWLRQVSSGRYPGIVGAACDRLLADGATSGRMLSLGVHPWLSGQAHRFKYLRAALEDLSRRPGVWHADGRSIAAHYRSLNP